MTMRADTDPSGRLRRGSICRQEDKAYVHPTPRTSLWLGDLAEWGVPLGGHRLSSLYRALDDRAKRLMDGYSSWRQIFILQDQPGLTAQEGTHQ